MISLYLNLYTDPDPQRNHELLEALARNKSNPLLEVHGIDGRPTFGEIFDSINQRSGPDDVNVFANSDIYFDETIALAQDVPADAAYLLSRWEWQTHSDGSRHFELYGKDGHPTIDCTDAWIWRGPCKIPLQHLNFRPGVPGCDNHLAWLFDNFYPGDGVNGGVCGPGWSIRAHHLHESGLRRYDREPRGAVAKPYLLIAPHVLGEMPRKEYRA
ncbi:MAG TPA: hypothetical protein VK797_22935 [Tepidisphaeraceae bacterium]|jgi:hypothetical protein|nr:hypothetical protein [Tepidisphaeraceae bacterium]